MHACMHAHKHMSRVQVRGQMALNSLPLDWGHQRSLCMLLSIYFTHHPSSDRGDPLDPWARVTCQWTIFSQARALTLCQHLFCRKRSRKRGLILWEARKPIIRNFSFIQRFNRLRKIYHSFHELSSSSERRPDSQNRWYACLVVPFYAVGRHSKQMPVWTPIEGYLQKTRIQTPPRRAPQAINQGVVSGILERRCYRCRPVYTLTLQLPLSL